MTICRYGFKHIKRIHLKLCRIQCSEILRNFEKYSGKCRQSSKSLKNEGIMVATALNTDFTHTESC